MIMYQCRLEQGNQVQIGWIAEKGAKVGARVELGPGTKDFWTVTKVSTPGMDASRLHDKQARDRNSLASVR